MESNINKIFMFFLNLFNGGKLLKDMALVGQDRAAFTQVVLEHRANDQKTPPARFRKKFTVTENEIEGFPLFTLQPRKTTAPQVFFYLHGGAYVTGPSSIHWNKVGELVRRTGFDAALLDYPKAPEHEAELTMQVAVAAYQALAAQYGAAQITVMGDSAGAGLALALAMQLKATGAEMPARLILLSPWMDVSMAHPEAQDLEKEDILLNCAGLAVCGEMYAGALGMQHPWVSPKFGELAGLPPVHLFVGGREVFAPDVRDFFGVAEAAGVKISLNYEPFMQHIWPLIPGIPEGKEATNTIVDIMAEV